MGIENILIANPKLGVIVISFGITLIMTLITKFFTNQNRIKELKKLQKDYQKKIKEAAGDFKKQSALQSEMMKFSFEMMKHSMKPMLFTMLPILFFFNWFRGILVTSDIAGSWLWYYMGTSIVSSMVLRKIMNVA